MKFNAALHPKSEHLIIDDLGICRGLKPTYDVGLHGGFENPPKIPSKCNTCRVVMIDFWDVVCSQCRSTSCRLHADAIDGQWVCYKCKDKK